MKSRTLTLDEHKAVGAELHRIRNRLLSLATEVRNRYPQRLRVCRIGRRVVSHVDRLRFELDGQASRDLGGAFTTLLYSPGPTAPPAPVGIIPNAPPPFRENRHISVRRTLNHAEHDALGAELQAIYQRLDAIMLCPLGGRVSVRVFKAWFSVYQILNWWRWVLEAQCCTDLHNGIYVNFYFRTDHDKLTHSHAGQPADQAIPPCGSGRNHPQPGIRGIPPTPPSSPADQAILVRKSPADPSQS